MIVLSLVLLAGIGLIAAIYDGKTRGLTLRETFDQDMRVLLKRATVQLIVFAIDMLERLLLRLRDRRWEVDE